jgi:hypothetical protein
LSRIPYTVSVSSRLHSSLCGLYPVPSHGALVPPFGTRWYIATTGESIKYTSQARMFEDAKDCTCRGSLSGLLRAFMYKGVHKMTPHGLSTRGTY